MHQSKYAPEQTHQPNSRPSQASVALEISSLEIKATLAGGQLFVLWSSAPQVGLEPTILSVNRVALVWVNKYSLRVSPKTRVVAPIFSEKLEPINCRRFWNE